MKKSTRKTEKSASSFFMKRFRAIDDKPPVSRLVEAALDIVIVEHIIDYLLQ